MSSLLRTAGELTIDHRASPGTREVPEGKLLEVRTYTCAHDGVIVVMNARRTRDRALCIRCMAVICDPCAATGVCSPFMSQYLDTPGVILSVPNAPAHTPSPPLGLLLPGHITH